MKRGVNGIGLSMAAGVVAMVAGTSLPALGSVTTDKKNGVENAVYFSSGFADPMGGPDILDPGYGWEDGNGKVIAYSEVPEFTAKEKKDIVDAQLATYGAKGAIAKDDDATRKYDCHGLTFSGGKTWINNDQVNSPIVADQGWAAVAEKDVKVGDVVIYNKGGSVTHTGIVTKTDGKGKVTEVRSKWGATGQYLHEPTVVPDSYGTPSYLTGGKALTVNPIGEADVKASKFYKDKIPVPALKPVLWNPTTNPTILDGEFAGGNQGFIPFGVATAALGNMFDYALTVPQTGMFVSPGDTFILYALGVQNAAVTGAASLASNGGWEVLGINGNQVTFVATSSTFVTQSMAGLLDGFSIESLYSQAGEICYSESAAGSVGVTTGPVPAPGAAALLGLGGILMAGRRRR